MQQGCRCDDLSLSLNACPFNVLMTWYILYLYYFTLNKSYLSLSLSRLPFIFITIYGVVCVQLVHFSIGDWKAISIAHVIIIIKSKVSTFPIVWDVCYIIFCYLLQTHSGITWNFFIIIVQFMMNANDTISLSSLCKLIGRHWFYKMPVRYILSCVWVR